MDFHRLFRQLPIFTVFLDGENPYLHPTTIYSQNLYNNLLSKQKTILQVQKIFNLQIRTGWKGAAEFHGARTSGRSHQAEIFLAAVF